MQKKYLLVFVLFSLVLTSCTNKNSTGGTPAKENSPTESKKASNASYQNPCKEEKVSLENYGDKGQRLKSCFVKYPGEPSRQDKSYYIVEDICGQFTKEFMENMLGEKLTKIEGPQMESLYNCSYYLDESRYIMANLEYLSIENQKIGNEAMGRKVEKDAGISMENLVVYQEDGPINVIYFVLSPEKFISLRPSSKDTITNEDFIILASKIGEEIKEYK